MKDEPVSQEALTAEVALLRQQVAALEAERVAYQQQQEPFQADDLQLNKILSESSVVFWEVNREGTITLATGKGLRTLGLEPEKVVGGSISDFFQEYPQIDGDVQRALAGEMVTSITDIGGLIFETCYAPRLNSQGQIIGVTGLAVDVTERQLMADILAQSEERHRAAAELTSDYAYATRVEATGRCIHEWVTGSFAYITGFTISEVNARGGWRCLVHPDDLAIIRDREASLLDGQFHLSEFRIITRAGEIRWIEDRARPVWGETEKRTVRIYGAALDITERKNAEMALREAHDELEKRVEARTVELARANAALRQEIIEREQAEAALRQLQMRLSAVHQLGRELTLMHDEDTIVYRVLQMATNLLKFNFAACGLVNKITDELEYRYHILNNSLEKIDIRMPISPVEARSIGAAVIFGERAINVPNTHQDKRYISLHPHQASNSALCVPLRVGEQIIGVLNAESLNLNHFTSDDQQLLQTIADQTAVALENARLYRNLQQQMQVLEEAQMQLVQSERMAALGRLSAAIAHEINNPLQAIKNVLLLFSEELETFPNNDELTDYLNVTKQEIDRISVITQRMRNFYRPLGRQLSSDLPPSLETINDFYRPSPQELQSIDLHSILKDVLRLVDKQLQQNDVVVKCHWADDVPQIQGNVNHLKQVFLNLILNAIEGLEGQRGTLYLRSTLDQVRSIDGDSFPFIRLEFGDTGLGISPDVMPHLFEPFFSTKKEGAGLGLFISHKIVEAHNGQISVESQPGLGTTFSILLPLEQPGNISRGQHPE